MSLNMTITVPHSTENELSYNVSIVLIRPISGNVPVRVAGIGKDLVDLLDRTGDTGHLSSLH